MAWRESHTSFIRERASGYYSTFTFVLAKVITDGVLLRIGPPLVLGGVIYPLAVLHPGRELLFLLGLCLLSFVSSTLCMALGALAPRSAAALPVAVLMLLVYLLFGSILMSKTPPTLKAISYFSSSYAMLVKNEFSGLWFQFDPKGVAEADFEQISGDEWMRLLGVADVSSGQLISALLGWAACYILIAWAALAGCCSAGTRPLPVGIE